MNASHLPRRTRARPRYTYAPYYPDDASVRKTLQQQRRLASGYGVLYIRCGGGYRVLRRDYLPGDERS